MASQEVNELLKKYQDGTATEAEVTLLLSLVQNWGVEEEVCITETDYAEVQAELSRSLFPEERKPRILSLWPRIAVAVCLLLALFIGFKFYYTGLAPAKDQLLAKNEIPAGGNKAYLTLASGQRIVLSDAPDGKLAEEEGVQIRKAANGQLVYTSSDPGKAGANPGQTKTTAADFNKIETPKGGQYQVNLPDGTRVWLNAASSLKFPASFSGLKERVVELNGEAYFEVTHQQSHPFIVRTAKQDVLVLGTHFNVNSYADEETTKTTLLQGAVLVKRNGSVSNPQPGKDFVLLKPGQEASLNEVIQVHNADVEMVVAWKDGNFMFNDVSLRNILRQLSRWYNVEVDYSNVPKDRFFTGFISRDVNLSKVLNMLQVTGKIRFSVADKTIRITDLNKQPM